MKIRSKNKAWHGVIEHFEKASRSKRKFVDRAEGDFRHEGRTSQSARNNSYMNIS